MKETAEIVCRKEPFGAVCERRGDPRGITAVYSSWIDKQVPKGESPIGKTIKMGGLKVRVIDRKFGGVGAYFDEFWVMPAVNPFGELTVVYRSAVHWLLRGVLNM
jgi:hypothetical protein